MSRKGSILINVLYVDDESGLLELTKRFLERDNDFVVETAPSAQLGMSMIKNQHFDAIVSDYQMPEMDGIAFLKRVRESGISIPFIVFTGKGREEVVIEAINSGADSYLQKGGNPKAQFADLAHKITQTVRRFRAEETVKENEARYRAIFQNASDIICILEQAGRIVYDSPSSERVLGYPDGALIGKNPFDYIHPGDRDRIRGDMNKAYEKKKPGTLSVYQYRMRTVNGEYLWVESVSINLLNVPNVNGIVMSIRPIPEKNLVG
jgi:PAS domain S-box-containing protein